MLGIARNSTSINFPSMPQGTDRLTKVALELLLILSTSNSDAEFLPENVIVIDQVSTDSNFSSELTETNQLTKIASVKLSILSSTEVKDLNDNINFSSQSQELSNVTVSLEDDQALLQTEVPELTEILGRKADWLDAIYIFFELMKLNIEGKQQEHIWRSVERKVQLEQIDAVVKNLEKTAEDQYSAGIMGGLTGICAGMLPMIGYTGIGESLLGVLQSSFSSFAGLKPIDAFDKLGKMLQSMSQMEQGMMDVRKTNAEADRHLFNQYGDITRSYCDDISRNRQELSQDHQATLQAILQFLNQNRELVNSLYGAG